MNKLKLPIIFLLLIYSINTTAQTIVITKSPQTVPYGKKWVLTSTMVPLVELDESAFISGSLYNAQLESNPRLLNFIAEGAYTRPNKVYQILFNGLSKVPYTNAVTYKISDITSFRCTNFPSTEYVNQQTITFYPGQNISVNGCLKSIQLMQLPFTSHDAANLRNKKQNPVTQNFNGGTQTNNIDNIPDMLLPDGVSKNINHYKYSGIGNPHDNDQEISGLPFTIYLFDPQKTLTGKTTDNNGQPLVGEVFILNVNKGSYYNIYWLHFNKMVEDDNHIFKLYIYDITKAENSNDENFNKFTVATAKDNYPNIVPGKEFDYEFTLSHNDDSGKDFYGNIVK